MPHRRKIAINALSATAGGGLAVARGLSAGLARIRPDWSFLLLHSHREAARDLDEPNLECVQFLPDSSVFRRLAWEQWKMIPFLKNQSVDAAILLGGFSPSHPEIPVLSVWQNANIWTPTTEISSWRLRSYIGIQRVLMRASLQRSDLNVFLSHDSAERCSESMKYSPDRRVVIPLGIDPRILEQVDIPDREVRMPAIVTIGDLYRHKRVEIIIDAFLRVRADHPALRCVIAGRPVDEAYMRDLRDRVREIGLEAQVDFRGGISLPEVIELYRTGLVYVTASRLETFGLTPIEAMASGLPVVAANASALPEIGGNAAILVDKDSVDAFASAIRRLCEDDVEWRRRRDLGLAHSRLYAWDQIAAEYADTLERLLTSEAPN